MTEDVIFSRITILHLADRPQYPNQLWFSNVLIELFQTEASLFQQNNTFVGSFFFYCNLFSQKLTLASCNSSNVIRKAVDI